MNHVAFQGPCVKAGGIAIEAEHGLGRQPPQNAYLILGQGRAQVRHRVAKARRMQGDHVPITLGRQGVGLLDPYEIAETYWGNPALMRTA